MDRAYYHAQQADAMAKRRYSDARSKPQIQGEELAALDALVTPLIKKGQPLTHICAEHEAGLPVSQRTLYHYIDSGKLSIGNLDLRRKVGYHPRKKKKDANEAFLNQKYRQNRTYEDFFTYSTASQHDLCGDGHGKRSTGTGKTDADAAVCRTEPDADFFQCATAKQKLS